MLLTHKYSCIAGKEEGWNSCLGKKSLTYLGLTCIASPTAQLQLFLTFFVISGHMMHMMHMTHMTLKYDITQVGRSWCLNDPLYLSNHTCQFFPLYKFWKSFVFSAKLKSIFRPCAASIHIYWKVSQSVSVDYKKKVKVSTTSSCVSEAGMEWARMKHFILIGMEWGIEESTSLLTLNTTNYVEYSIRMTKDIQFLRLRAEVYIEVVPTWNKICTPAIQGMRLEI